MFILSLSSAIEAELSEHWICEPIIVFERIWSKTNDFIASDMNLMTNELCDSVYVEENGQMKPKQKDYYLSHSIPYAIRDTFNQIENQR